MLAELSIHEFAARLASRQPAPGGGSAAAVSGLLGVSLLEMAVNLSLGRPDLAAYADMLADRQKVLAGLHKKLEELIDRDADAFSAVMAAYGLPKATAEEKEARAAQIQQAMRQAAEVPVEVARAALESLEIGRALLGKINAHVVSDLMIGVLLSYNAVMAALLNTAINLPALRDHTVVAALKGQIHILRTAADELYNAVADEVYGADPFAVMRME
ncbi:cyclodeaminase/cyclohydrolase family protein [Sporolituus thermophilus]|uniref:Formiminotetrahydrofolate cyclodeaminase n=1 Tax=Sporolituus thermophilus DSM 23256 TaxID=1123285 RepID=A0A1G7MYN9_9FIRM|nr:cyclodeaminase/cyclohydrolase family protein [Sporolituus thermophilus]SDF66239.1 Formiminotetrahydrofolate cyclodeaminase [Sporolituus thermophilus DSM 23256]